MNADPSHVNMESCVRMFLGLTSLTMYLETSMNSTLIMCQSSHISMKVYVWMEETKTNGSGQVVDSQGHSVRF